MASMYGKMKAAELLAEVFSLKAVNKAVAKANQRRIASQHGELLSVVESVVASKMERQSAVVNIVLAEVETLKLDPMDEDAGA